MENRSSSRLKQRLVRMFRTSTLLRSPCSSSTSASTLSSGAATSSLTFSTDTTANEPAIIPSNHISLRDGNANDIISPHHPSSLESLDRSLSLRLSLDDHRRQRSSSRFSLDCIGCQPSRFSDVCGLPPLMAKAKKERRLRETGGSYETTRKEGKICPPPVFPISPSSPFKNCYYYYNKMEDRKKEKKKKKKKLLSNSYGFTSSSSDSNCDEFGFFSGEERVEDKGEEETETFFSSRSFSSDSSGFYQRPSKTKKKDTKKKKKKKTTRRPPRSTRGSSYRPVVPVSSKEEQEGGFAVVKRSSDPYADFRTSMVEMIVERQKFGADDMEWLLQSYLSLNAPLHHPVIIKAFTDIWEALFSN